MCDQLNKPIELRFEKKNRGNSWQQKGRKLTDFDHFNKCEEFMSSFKTKAAKKIDFFSKMFLWHNKSPTTIKALTKKKFGYLRVLKKANMGDSCPAFPRLQYQSAKPPAKVHIPRASTKLISHRHMNTL